jgi:PhnB protein
MSTARSDASTTAIEPWLTVPDAREALDFYLGAFGALEAYRLDDDDGRPVVARLSIGGAAFWIQGDADASQSHPGLGRSG